LTGVPEPGIVVPDEPALRPFRAGYTRLRRQVLAGRYGRADGLLDVTSKPDLEPL